MTIYIPKKIKVGYDERKDTYTGMLAYVIYYDEKGKLRKENSWESWRDKSIEPDDFDNVPTEGFVLNKHVGGYSSGWNHRNSYIRIYDPRGFEFEISIENLLFILTNCSSIKGKGLEGQFVYAWDGKDLLLLPVDSPDYKKIMEETEARSNATYFKGKELKPGLTYETLNGGQYLYLGKFDCYEEETNGYRKSRWRDNYWDFPLDDTWLENPLSNYSYNEFKSRFVKKKGKRFCFAKIENGKIKIYHTLWRSSCNHTITSTITNRFCKIANENIHPKFSEIIECFESYNYISPAVFNTIKIEKLSKDYLLKRINNLKVGEMLEFEKINYNTWLKCSFEKIDNGYYTSWGYPYHVKEEKLKNTIESIDNAYLIERYLENGNKEIREDKEWDL